MSSRTVWVNKKQVQGEQWLKRESLERKMETDRQREVGEGKKGERLLGFAFIFTEKTIILQKHIGSTIIRSS